MLVGNPALVAREVLGETSEEYKELVSVRGKVGCVCVQEGRSDWWEGCYEPSPANTCTLDATTSRIPSLVPRSGLDCLTASKTGYPKIRIWNPVLCSQLTNKLIIDLKSFCLFPLVSMTESYSKKESNHESSLRTCITMKLVYK